MVDIDETELPGIGIRREFTTRGGTRLGVVETRSGTRDLLLYDRDDPDMCRVVVPLGEKDSDVLSNLLGANVVRNDAASKLMNLEGLAIDWISVDPASVVADMSIGAAEIRSRTGATVAAIIDGNDSVPGPGPDEILRGGTTIVAVGSNEGVMRLHALLSSQAQASEGQSSGGWTPQGADQQGATQHDAAQLDATQQDAAEGSPSHGASPQGAPDTPPGSR